MTNRILINRVQYFQMLIDINTQVASFRDMLIHIGHDKHDCPELRAQIRKTRRACVESCIKVAKLILPQLKRLETDKFSHLFVFLSSCRVRSWVRCCVGGVKGNTLLNSIP